MMKRVITFLLVILSLLSNTITCFAAESEEVDECPVYAKYHSSNIELNTTIVENGKGTLTNQDGSSVIVDFEDKYNGYVLVVHLITENDKDAFAWFKSCVPNDVVDFSPYEIYLLNSENERVELPNNTSIQISVSNRSDFIVGLSYSGETSDINTTYKDGNLTFKSSEQSNYYLRCRKSVGTDVDADLPQPEDLPGDANVDGKVSIADARLILVCIANVDFSTMTEQGLINGDVNYDSKRSIADVRKIIVAIANNDYASLKNPTHNSNSKSTASQRLLLFIF